MVKSKSTDARSSDSKVVSRREFLTGAAAAMAVPYVVPETVLGKGNIVAPSERITIGSIGVGGQGANHINILLPHSNVQFLAVCDPYQSKCNRAKKKIEDHYSKRKGNGGTYKGCDTYSDFRKMIARKDIDAVFIASPEYWHGLHGAMSAEAGKDIYAEKALTLTYAEGKALIKKVRRYGRVFQVGLQQRSSRNFRFACELARNGYLGRLHTVKVGVPGGRSLPYAIAKPAPPGLDYEMWLGPAPFTPYNDLKCSFNWYFIYDYCVGWIQSWGIHHIDTAQWGVPSLSTGQIEVEGAAVFPTEGLADTSITWDVNIYSKNGVRLNFQDNEKNEQGCRFEGDKGWVHVSRTGIKAEPASLLKTNIKPDEIHLYESSNHHENFLECVRTRQETAAPVEVGHKATTITIISDIATRLRRRLTWDWKTESFLNDTEANNMLSRPMRSPWHM